MAKHMDVKKRLESIVLKDVDDGRAAAIDRLDIYSAKAMLLVATEEIDRLQGDNRRLTSNYHSNRAELLEWKKRRDVQSSDETLRREFSNCEQAIEDSRSNDLLEENKRLVTRIADLEAVVKAVTARRDVVVGRLRSDVTMLVELDRTHRRLFDRRFAWCRPSEPKDDAREREISDEMVFARPR